MQKHCKIRKTLTGVRKTQTGGWQLCKPRLNSSHFTFRFVSWFTTIPSVLLLCTYILNLVSRLCYHPYISIFNQRIINLFVHALFFAIASAIMRLYEHVCAQKIRESALELICVCTDWHKKAY